MKKILLVFSLLLSSQSFGLTPRELTCSYKGTDIIYVNGISWTEDYVTYTVEKYLISKELDHRLLDSSVLTANPGIIPYPEVIISYNHARSVLKDLTESAAQKLSLSFEIPLDETYALAYFTLYPTPLNPLFIDSITNINNLKFSDALNSILSTFNPDDYIDAVATEYSVMQADLKDLKQHISNSLILNKKLIIISESQGNLFVNKAIEELKATSLNMGESTKDIRDYEFVLGNLQIATPVYSNISKNKVVLNDDDIIRIVFFDRPSPTFKDFSDPEIDRRHPLDKYLDHFVDGTYLNAYGSSEPLPRLKEFTLQSLIDTASLLESNCPIAVLNFDYSIENLTVDFDSTDPENPGINDLIYEWDFGDGRIETTYSKRVKHTYLAPGKYNVTLRVTNSEGRDFGEPATTQKEVVLIDDIIGCFGYEAGKFHINPDGSVGGFIANTASVASTAYIGPYTNICGSSQILGNSRISSPSVSISGGPNLVRDSLIIDSVIQTSNHLEIIYSTISGLTVSPIVYSVLVEDSSISNSNFTNTDYIMVTYNSTINDSSFQGDNVVVQLQAVINSMTFNLESQLSVYGNSVYYEDRSGTLADWPF